MAEENVKQRLKRVLEYYNVTQNKLAEGDSALQKRLSTQLNGKTSLSFQTISSILERFPDVSSEWVLSGTGRMDRCLKQIGVIDNLSTYYARHSWATIAAEIDITFEVISAALGHSIANPTTAIYINFNQRKVDEANRKVIDYVFA